MTVHEWLADWAQWGWPLVANHLWQATLFSAIVFPVVVVLRRGPSRARYAIWVIAGLKFALPSALMGLLIGSVGFDLSARRISIDEGSDALTAVTQFAAPVHQGNDAAIEAAGSEEHSELYCGLTLVWLSGVVILLGSWVTRRRRFSRSVKAGRTVTSGRESEALRRARLSLRTRRAVSLIISSRVVEPGVWRVLRPAILLPEGMADGLSDPELEAVMAHELIHVARWDNLVSNLQMLLCCLFWFHPLTWIIDRRLMNERERACDEAVVALGGEPQVYASSLLKVLKFCLGWRVAGVSYAAGSNLVRRVERIMANESDRTIRISHLCVIGFVGALVVAFAIAAGIASREQVAALANTLQTAGPPSEGTDSAMVGDAADLDQELKGVRAKTLEFTNQSGSPVTITGATAKWVRLEERRRKKEENTSTYFMLPSLKLVNNSERLIAAVAIEFKATDGSVKLNVERVSSLVGPHDSFALNGRFVQFDGNPASAVARVAGVLFRDDTTWGDFPPAPPPPPPPPPPPHRVKADRPPPPPPPPPKPPKTPALPLVL